MKKRFKKVVTNPETGRKNTIRYGLAGMASDGKDRIRPGKKMEVQRKQINKVGEHQQLIKYPNDNNL